ncbi:MAG: cystathionine beta-lyase [Proteobacteria bacterium]|nr:cystathionine beta-lyase [Pseudomonadota bacterium]
MLASAAIARAAGQEPLPPVHIAYLKYCGGCHGIQGVSAPKTIPTLKNEAGRFLCTDDGRRYLVRLPNIARAPVSDELLADLLNFVVFGLGGASVPAGAPRYDATEVSALRRQPLTNRLDVYRQRILTEVRTAGCG